MHTVNKNKIVEYYYNECSDNERKEIFTHLAECNDCSEYLETIKSCEKKLNIVKAETPSEHILSNILLEVEESATVKVKPRELFSIVPILQILFGLMFILTVVYIINSKISLLPIWQKVESLWFIQTFGTIGVAVLLVLCVGVFITFSIAPILLFESEAKKNLN